MKQKQPSLLTATFRRARRGMRDFAVGGCCFLLAFGPTVRTAAQDGDRRERQDRAIAAVEQDGFVREVIEMFDATLIESSIKPV